MQQKKEDIASWDEEETRLREARRKRRFFDVSPEDTDDLKVISDAQTKLGICVVPSLPCGPKVEMLGKLAAMPIVCFSGKLEAAMTSKRSERDGKPHQKQLGRFAEKRFVSGFLCGLVHKPITIKESMKHPEARASVDKPWSKQN